MMSNLQAAVRALAPAASSPADLCRQLNEILAASVAAAKYISLFYMELNVVTGTLQYCNAGHNPPMLLSTDDSVSRLTVGGLVLGAFAERSYEQSAATIAAGGRLLMFTDGITEAQNAHDAFFDEDRLRELVRANLGRSAWDIQDGVIAQVDAFVGDAPQFDDITMMVVVRGSLQTD